MYALLSENPRLRKDRVTVATTPTNQTVATTLANQTVTDGYKCSILPNILISHTLKLTILAATIATA